MYTAILYYNHDKFAVLHYSESDGNWRIYLDEFFMHSTEKSLYNIIMEKLRDFLTDFNELSEGEDFDFSKFVHSYDVDFYMVEI